MMRDRFTLLRYNLRLFLDLTRRATCFACPNGTSLTLPV